MITENPRAARVSVFGDWGSAEDVIYSNWEEADFDIGALKMRTDLKFAYGLDFGYKVSFNAFVAIAYDPLTRSLWVYDEMYSKGMTNLDIAKKIISMGYGKEKIWADAAEPKSIFELREGLIEERTVERRKEYVRYSLPNIIEAVKGPDSVANGISRVQEYHIFVHYTCRNMILELNNYAWAKDKDGRYTGKPEKEFDHLCDALRYALTGELIKGHGGVVEARGMDERLVRASLPKAEPVAVSAPEPVYELPAPAGEPVAEEPTEPVPATQAEVVPHAHVSRVGGVSEPVTLSEKDIITMRLMAPDAPPVNTLNALKVVPAEGPEGVAPPKRRARRVFSSSRVERACRRGPTHSPWRPRRPSSRWRHRS